MQQLDVGQMEEVSGALTWTMVGDMAAGWFIERSLTWLASSIGDFAANGVPPDYSRTTAMGDMY